MKRSMISLLFLFALGAMIGTFSFDSERTSTGYGYEIVLSEDGTVSTCFSVPETCYTVSTLGSKAVIDVDYLTVEVEKFYISSHKSNDLYTIPIGELAEYQFT